MEGKTLTNEINYISEMILAIEEGVRKYDALYYAPNDLSIEAECAYIYEELSSPPSDEFSVECARIYMMHYQVHQMMNI